jgi:hypothetical protein
MTTNVFDEVLGVMATDSRWSVQYGEYIVYIDDSGYEKILICHNHAVMFAGNGNLIQQWKDWMNSMPVDASNQPAVEGICVCIVDMGTKKVKSSVKQLVLPSGGYFAGSGQLYAVHCWLKNSNSYTAVETAKANDKLSGGDVKFYDFTSGKNNLNLNYPANVMSIQMVNTALLKRGLVMKTATGATQAIPYAVAANDDPELENVGLKIMSGELSASAPSEGMYSPWTEEEKLGLKTALVGMFGWSN